MGVRLIKQKQAFIFRSESQQAEHGEQLLLEREGKAVTNFEERLPASQSDLACESLKDPYRLDFLGVVQEADERAIESAIVQHITRFLLELGPIELLSLCRRCTDEIGTR
jgi:predicted nuclease of restriction endonuclease-like (RecB) superfamily